MFGGFSPSRVAPLFSQRPLSSTLTQQSDQVINGDFLLKRNLLASRQGMSCKSQKASWILTLHLKYAAHTYTHTHTHIHTLTPTKHKHAHTHPIHYTHPDTTHPLIHSHYIHTHILHTHAYTLKLHTTHTSHTRTYTLHTHIHSPMHHTYIRNTPTTHTHTRKHTLKCITTV